MPPSPPPVLLDMESEMTRQWKTDTSDRRYETVRRIEIRIGDECVQHDFGRPVSMLHARQLALHFINVLTGEPSEWVNGERP